MPSCPSSLFVRDWTLGLDCPRAHAGERGQRAREGAEDELLGDQPSNASDQADSGCLSPLVSMVQSTDSRQCNDFRHRRRSARDRSQARCVLVQPQVATVLVIVADVSLHEPDEMTCAENHDVLKELATAAADPVLCQNSALLEETINQQLSVCVRDRANAAQGSWVRWAPERSVFFWVYAGSCGLKTAFLGNGGRNAATIFSLRYPSSR